MTEKISPAKSGSYVSWAPKDFHTLSPSEKGTPIVIPIKRKRSLCRESDKSILGLFSGMRRPTSNDHLPCFDKGYSYGLIVVDNSF